MTEVHRPVTPNQGRSTSSRLLAAPEQPIPIQTSNMRPGTTISPLSPVNQNGSYAFDRVIKRGKVERRLKKKGAWKASWKAVYLVLRPNLLSVYKDADETDLRASITLSDVTAVAPVKKSKHDHVFAIFSPSKNHHFSTQTPREASDWITALRIEARTGEQDELQPPNAGFQQRDGQDYETTDLSADDDLEAPASPEVPQWSVKAQKTRILPQANQDPRRTSGLAPYPSGNESFATSQSDFSDGFSSSTPGPKGYLGTSVPVQPSTLSPIPDDKATVSRPTYNRDASYLSDTGGPTSQPISKSAPKQLPQTAALNDPSRVVRQGYLRLSKTISGVRQWKTIWVVLRASSVSFYKSHTEPSPGVMIPTHKIIEAAEIDRKNKQNCFQVIGEEKTYKLQTETEDELEGWLGAFKSILVRQEAERKEARSRGPSISNEGQMQKVDLAQGQQRPVQPPSRDGTAISGLSAQLKGVNLNQNQAQNQPQPQLQALAQGQTQTQMQTQPES